MKTGPAVFNLPCTGLEPPARFPRPPHSLELEILDQQSTSRAIRLDIKMLMEILKGNSTLTEASL